MLRIERKERQGCVRGREKETERRVVWLYFRKMHFVCVIIGRGQTQLDVDKHCFEGTRTQTEHTQPTAVSR